VSRTEPKTYMEIRHVFDDENRDVRVILDRRGRERRRSDRAVPTERRYNGAAPSGRDVGAPIIRLGRGQAREKSADPRCHSLCRTALSGGRGCWPEWRLAVSNTLRHSLRGDREGTAGSGFVFSG
jgi:hypothetical protein